MNDSLAPLSSARWHRLIPIAFITYSFAYVDRSNYSIGAAGGLVDKLRITSAQSGLLGGLFFIGYFLFQVPAGFLRRAAQHHPIRAGTAVYVPLPREPQLDAG